MKITKLLLFKLLLLAPLAIAPTSAHAMFKSNQNNHYSANLFVTTDLFYITIIDNTMNKYVTLSYNKEFLVKKIEWSTANLKQLIVFFENNTSEIIDVTEWIK